MTDPLGRGAMVKLCWLAVSAKRSGALSQSSMVGQHLQPALLSNCVKIRGDALIAGISQSRVQLFRIDLIRGHC